jgi:hypothetical protein
LLDRLKCVKEIKAQIAESPKVGDTILDCFVNCAMVNWESIEAREKPTSSTHTLVASLHTMEQITSQHG